MTVPWAGRVLADASDRVAWLEARGECVTASDVANILGLGSKSRNMVLREKVSGERVGEDPGELAMVAAGRHLERGVFEWFADETLHESAGMCGLLIADPARPYLAATPDALLDGEPVEVKCTMYSTRPNWHRDTTSMKGWPTETLPLPIATNTRWPPENLRTARADEGTPKGLFRDACRYALQELFPLFGSPVAPLKYWVQLQVQMQVLGVERGWIVALHAGTGRMDLYYARDHSFAQWMNAEVDAFWNDWREAKKNAA